MKVLLLCTSSEGGGAANASLRLFSALNKIGIEARLLTLYDNTSSLSNKDSIYKGLRGKIKALSYKAIERIDVIRHNNVTLSPLWRFSSAPYSPHTLKHPWFEWADIIHLHWINHGLLSISDIQRLSYGTKPIVWTLHDLWAVTGGCHIPFEFHKDNLTICTQYYVDCSKCPLLSGGNYAQRLLHSKRSFNSENIHYIAVSQREAELIKLSPLQINTDKVTVISPNLDIRPKEISDCQEYPWYHLNTDYIILVAANPKDLVKGPYLLEQVCLELKKLVQRHQRKIELIVVGDISRSDTSLQLVIPTHFLGLKSEQELRYLYSISRVCISTSIFETFGQTLIESLSEGTPVIAFRSFGPEDIIVDGVNGYLINSYNSKAMAESIIKLIENVVQGKITKEACKASIHRFSSSVIAEQHKELYEELLKPNN